jgi:hypothetical protein
MKNLATLAGKGTLGRTTSQHLFFSPAQKIEMNAKNLGQSSSSRDFEIPIATPPQWSFSFRKSK